MKKNIFNKIIRGDGQEKELPLTRRKQILSIVKDNYGYLFVYQIKNNYFQHYHLLVYHKYNNNVNKYFIFMYKHF